MTETFATTLSPAWFCLRCQSKHEHIAATHLEKEAAVQVYLPRIRFKRSTRRGPVWFTEALFPGYLFARFDRASVGRRVHHTQGVLGIVHFGGRWPPVPDEVIDDLRAMVGSANVHVASETMAPGEDVKISGGAFHDLSAVVVRVMPARQRIAVLLEFLGRQTMVEIPNECLVRNRDERQALESRAGSQTRPP